MGSSNYHIVFYFLFYCLSTIKPALVISNCPHTITNVSLLSDLQELDLSWTNSLYNINITGSQIQTMLTLMNVALYNMTNFYWNYAENLNDGKGITFGIMLFTSGSFDGRRVIEKINDAAMQNGISHPLAAYFQAFLNIDNSEHDIYGNTSFIGGLDNFIQDWQTYGSDLIAKQAQLDVINDLYWEPTIDIARSLKINHTASVSQLFDICMNQGCDQDGYNNFGLIQLINMTDDALTIGLAEGANERDWNEKLAEIRNAYIDSDDIWNNSRAYTRAEIQRRIVETKDYNITLPLDITCVDQYQGGGKIRAFIFFFLLLTILQLFI